MLKLEDHPTVRSVRLRTPAERTATLDAGEVRRICLEAGADDVGFVSIDRPEIAGDLGEIRRLLPSARALISIVCRMNPEPIRTPSRSVSNLEFHATGEKVNEVARDIATALSRKGVRAVNPSMGFPMEMDRFPGRIWTVSHKPLAVAAGLGQMGIHRNVIHPRFGNFILLGAVVIDTPISEESRPIDYNPCLECKLCVAACPVGAIAPDGGFNFFACGTHNYREFMGGFVQWVETVAESGSAKAYGEKYTDSETASTWQSLAFGPNYKAAYCLSVCPAGEEVIAPFLSDRAGFIEEILKPLQAKQETIYVQPGSDAEARVAKRFPRKQIKQVGSVFRPSSIQNFVRSMHLAFQPGRAAGLDAVYHFIFTGAETLECTITIRDQKIEVRDGLVGECNLRMTADARGWLRFLRKQTNIVWLLLTRRVKLKGNPRLLSAFGKCFI